MVCEKNAGVKHDFAKDPIQYVMKMKPLMLLTVTDFFCLGVSFFNSVRRSSLIMSVCYAMVVSMAAGAGESGSPGFTLVGETASSERLPNILSRSSE